MSHPTGKTLIQGDDGQLYIVSRERSAYGDLRYALYRITETELVDRYLHKYQAVRAAAPEGGAR